MRRTDTPTPLPDSPSVNEAVYNTLSSISVWEAAVVIGAAVFILGFIGRKMWPPIRSIWPVLRKAVYLLDVLVGDPKQNRAGLVDRFTESEKTLREVRHKVYPNGGDSIADQVTFLRRDLETHTREERAARETLVQMIAINLPHAVPPDLDPKDDTPTD